MRLRLQINSKKYPVEVSDDESIARLFEVIKATTSEDVFSIKTGFPPKDMDTGDMQQSLKSAGIRSGETILIITNTGVPKSQAISTSSMKTEPLTNADVRTIPNESRKKEILQNTFSFGHVKGASPGTENGDNTLPPEINIANKGIMTLRVQPDDNSCLFRAIGYLCMRSVDAMEELRQLIATTIQEKPEDYPDAVLGMKRDVYCAKMNRADTWGGEIEMKILSDHFQIQIASIDCKSGHIYRYGEHFADCIYIVYSGIHYDALAVMPAANAPPEWDQTQFPSSDLIITKAAQDLVAVLRARNYFTDTSSFDLRCNDCGIGLKGEAGAQKHALESGHVNFGEYRA